MKVLESEALVRINGQFRALKAVLVLGRGGYRVIYLDKDGCEAYSEPLSKSQFKDLIKEIKSETKN